MEHQDSFMPVIPRLDRLLQLLEDKQKTYHFCEEKSNKDCKSLSSALEEVQHKGTLIERLTALENRVLQLSLEIDEGNTAKSSSSTHHKQDPPSIQLPQEREDGFVGVIRAQHKSKGQKKITEIKWLGLFRLRC